jgi:3',5'-cyclic AMP phosphodiesterase CpdA
MQRFIVLADVHLGLSGLQPDGRTYGDVEFLLERAVQGMARLDPRQVILLGDLVNRGYDAEYQRVRRALEPIASRVIPLPGNHELQRASIADFERNMNVRAFRTTMICGLRTIILNSGIENLPDTQWHGALDERQLRFLDDELARTPPGAPLVVLVHHPIVGTVRDSGLPMFGLDNSHDLQSRLERHDGRVIVISAHTHSQSFTQQRGRFSYVGAPPLGFWPHALLVVDVDEREMRFSTVRLLDRHEDSPDPGAALPDYRAAREGTAADQSGTIPLRG